VERDVTTSTAATRLAAEIATAARRPDAARVLVLDLDGTLAPIAAQRHAARVPDVVLDALSRLHRHGWRVAIVTGRPFIEARRLVPLPGIAVFGSHGIEREGAPRAMRSLREAARRSATIARQARAFLREFPGVELERKPYGCAFHYRALRGAARAQFLRRLSTWLAGCDTRGLERLRGKSVVELRPEGQGKGEVASYWPAVRAVRPGDRSLVAIGDDFADEELFAALDDRGLTIRVGATARTTIARRRVRGTATVARLLVILAAVGEEERRDGRS
jgi:trehalose 6-phosphate phosphatase